MSKLETNARKAKHEVHRLEIGLMVNGLIQSHEWKSNQEELSA